MKLNHFGCTQAVMGCKYLQCKNKYNIISYRDYGNSEKKCFISVLYTIQVNSVFLVVAIATLFVIALPNATDFVWLFYKVYLAMAMGYFVDLTMAWYGGESEMLQLVGEGTEINLRTPPCCCCFCICRKPIPFTKQRIQILRGSVYQVSIK